MTSLTLSSFFDFIFAWTGFWLTLTVILLMTRAHKEAPDYEIIGFRAAIAFVCASVFTFRWWDFNPLVLVPAYSIFAWTAAATCVRIAIKIWREQYAPGPEDHSVERPPYGNGGPDDKIHTYYRTEQYGQHGRGEE